MKAAEMSQGKGKKTALVHRQVVAEAASSCSVTCPGLDVRVVCVSPGGSGHGAVRGRPALLRRALMGHPCPAAPRQPGHGLGARKGQPGLCPKALRCDLLSSGTGKERQCGIHQPCVLFGDCSPLVGWVGGYFYLF